VLVRSCAARDRCSRSHAAVNEQSQENKTKQKNIKMNRLVVVSLIFYQQHKQEEGKEKKNNKTEM
jgi:hypothetical protein